VAVLHQTDGYTAWKLQHKKLLQCSSARQLILKHGICWFITLGFKCSVENTS